MRIFAGYRYSARAPLKFSRVSGGLIVQRSRNALSPDIASRCVCFFRVLACRWTMTSCLSALPRDDRAFNSIKLINARGRASSLRALRPADVSESGKKLGIVGIIVAANRAWKEKRQRSYVGRVNRLEFSLSQVNGQSAAVVWKITDYAGDSCEIHYQSNFDTVHYTTINCNN